MNDAQSKKAGKILLLFLTIGMGFCIFLGTIFYQNFASRKLPNFQAKRIESAIRGNIYSSDDSCLPLAKKSIKQSSILTTLIHKKRTIRQSF